MILHNIYDKKVLNEKIKSEEFQRITLSFYNYSHIENLKCFRDELYMHLSNLKVLGRIYLAKEGINAQISLPDFYLEKLKKLFQKYNFLKSVSFKEALENRQNSFLKLKIKIRKKIVADGLEEDLDLNQMKKEIHISAEEFDKISELENSIIVDMRNHYESEVGHFKNAVLPDTDSFRETILWVENFLKNQKKKNLLLYCTGGIRCEKASVYLTQKGFESVYQLRGGIIQYVREIRQKNLKSNFIGKNFVFDNRLSEKVTEDIVSHCHQCGQSSDRHINCKNDMCHLLFIQCEKCAEKMENCCTEKCKDFTQLPLDKQKKARKNKVNRINHYNSKKQLLGPKICQI